MVARLEALRRAADPRSDIYDTSRLIDYLEGLPVPGDARNRLRLDFRRGQALLIAGRTSEAISLFEAIQGRVESGPLRLDPALRELEDLLAIAYLRLGEQRNCLDHHSPESCLLPIRGGGVHRDPLPARHAAALYAAILEERPDDALVQWLLNVAAMAAGDYPGGVPERWRIPPETFAAQGVVGRFPNVAAAANVDVVGLSGGLAIEDFDDDGGLDVMVSSWGLGDPIRVFRNRGDGGFDDLTDISGLSGLTGGLNLVQADYDNDGDTDVLVLRGAWLGQQGEHPNSLLRNRGDFTFEDVTEAAGVLDFVPTQTAAWGDYDGDGWLDLFVGAETVGAAIHRSRLYHNRGDGGFDEVGREVGADVIGYVKGSAWGDFDNDGRPDLYVSRLLGANVLLHNEGADGDGTWRFRDVAAEAGVEEPLHSFPTWFWDYDNDGWLDLFVSGYPVDILRAVGSDSAAELLGRATGGERPRLYRNRGDGTFADATAAVGLDRVFYSMGSNFGDLDNDGWLDFYLGTGAPDFRSLMPNRMLRNAAGTRFEDVTSDGGFGHLQKGHAIAFADLDEDGDQDVYAVMGGAFSGDTYPNALFRNPGHGNHWIKLRLVGTRASRSAIGARLRLRWSSATGLREIDRQVGTGGSFGAGPLLQEIGLGAHASVEHLEIVWPGSGTVQTFSDLPANAAWLLREGDSEPRRLALRPFVLGAAAEPHSAGD
jgi:ASPIC and UnbV/FG-GAP-like repeat